jgi:HPt (histidine-containing phosphotransfer) domain-containing protein
VLSMFRDQAPTLLLALRAAEGAARAEVAHRLKGSALAIGASGLAEAAAALEAAPGDAVLIDAVEDASGAVVADVDRILAG